MLCSSTHTACSLLCLNIRLHTWGRSIEAVEDQAVSFLFPLFFSSHSTHCTETFPCSQSKPSCRSRPAVFVFGRRVLIVLVSPGRVSWMGGQAHCVIRHPTTGKLGEFFKALRCSWSSVQTIWCRLCAKSGYWGVSISTAE